jgi:N-acyl homoserine lactone hydrolase
MRVIPLDRKGGSSPKSGRVARHSRRPRGLLLSAAVRAAVLALASTAGCGSYRPPATPFHAPAQAARDWESVLHQPSKITVERLETGRVRVMTSDLIDFNDPKTSGLTDTQLFVPVFAYLLRHEDRGDYLIDAGLDRSFQKITSGDMSGLFAFKFYAVQAVGEDLPSQLDQRGAKLRGIFFTHLHPDHLSGATSLPRDIPYVVGKGESPTSVGALFHEDALDGVRDFQELDFSAAPAMAPLGPCLDVFGDGSFWAISTPGHTVGHVSFLVVTKTGPVLITGDVSHTRWGFDRSVIPGKFNDGKRSDSRQSLNQLEAFAKAYPDVKIFLGHER